MSDREKIERLEFELSEALGREIERRERVRMYWVIAAISAVGIALGIWW